MLAICVKTVLPDTHFCFATPENITVYISTIGPGGSIVGDSGENVKHASICTDWMIKFPVISSSLPAQGTAKPSTTPPFSCS